MMVLFGFGLARLMNLMKWTRQFPLTYLCFPEALLPTNWNQTCLVAPFHLRTSSQVGAAPARHCLDAVRHYLNYTLQVFTNTYDTIDLHKIGGRC